jgi:hypothetical protein
VTQLCSDAGISVVVGEGNGKVGGGNAVANCNICTYRSVVSLLLAK